MRPPPPLLAVCAAAAQAALSSGRGSRSALRTSGSLVVAAASGALAAASAREFRHEGTTLEPFEPAKASVLVTTGANSVSRNPMYVGLTGLLVANALRLGSAGALVPVVAFVVVIDRLQIAAEESALLDRFGADYESYRSAVPRWLDARSARLGATA